MFIPSEETKNTIGKSFSNKITMYELLGLIKDDKAPKIIKYNGTLYEYDSFVEFYYNDGLSLYREFYLNGNCLNDEVEILEEKEKKIPEKLPFECGKISDNDFLAKYISHNRNAINEIIDYLEYFKSKGE